MKIPGRRPSPGVNDLASQYPDLAGQWSSRNGFGPEQVRYGARFPVWWVCAHGHEWDAPPNARTAKGNGCPICSGARVEAGVNDLATTHPELAAQWCAENSTRPDQVSAGSNTPVLWECAAGHRWQAPPNRRTGQETGNGCRVCYRREVEPGVTDLATTHPDLAAQWVSGPEGTDPSTVSAGSKTKVRWRCASGHEWDAALCDRTRADSPTGCPVCAGRKIVAGVNDLRTSHPELAALWDDQRPCTEVGPGSHYRAAWRCAKGHSWHREVRRQVSLSTTCPYCCGDRVIPGETDLGTLRPERAAQWSARNPGSPATVPLNSNTPVWWECAKGHEWFVSPNDREQHGSGCPQCRSFTSAGERELAAFVESLGAGPVVRTERSAVRGHELDIYLPGKSVAVEYNGNWFHSERFRARDYHHQKYLACREAGIRLIQVWEDEWRDRRSNVEGLLRSVLGVDDRPRVHARKAEVVSLTAAESAEFLDAHHLQGHGSGGIRLALWWEGRAVAVLVARLRASGQAEIVRYATAARVPGGFSRLLAALDRQCRARGIAEQVTFADLRISDGALYRRTGFLLDAELAPDYQYVWGRRRSHKFSYRVARFREDPALRYVPGMTERELAALNGMDRLWDAGKLRFVRQVPELA